MESDNTTESTIYVEYKEGEKSKAETMFRVDEQWAPRNFLKEGVFVFRGKATEAQIQLLKDAGFKVHVDKAAQPTG
jgi:hypothetical protein